jgi:flagellar basal body-associated protein FliL
MMTDESKSPAETAEEEESLETTTGSGRTLVIAFVAVVVLLETAMFFFLVPSADEVSAFAEASLIKSVQEGEDAAEEQESNEKKRVEFNLGRFGETFSPTGSERTFRLEIELYALVYNRNVKKMDSEFDDKQGRLRNEIRNVIRNSGLDELKKSQLGLLERRILTKCNHLLDEDLLLAVGFNNYQLSEE